MLTGNWPNIKALEESLCMAELELLLSAARDKESRHNKFMAALKGVNLDSTGDDAADKVEEMKRRLESQKTGRSEEELQLQELGFTYETG